MTSLWQRLSALGQLVRMKQKAFRVKTKMLSLIINNNGQIKSLKRVNFQFQTVAQLIKRLIFINTKQLTFMLILSLFSLILRLFCANINTFIVDQFEEQQSTINLVYCIIFLAVYKIGKAIVDQWSSYKQMSYGFMGYSSLYYHFLKGKSQMTGEILNIVEDDMEKLTNLPYSLINFPFLTILIVVLTIMLSYTLEFNVILIVLISLILYSANCIGGAFIFSLNEKLMKQKDYRLSLNLSQNNDPQTIKQARKKQVTMTKTFLMVKVIVKWLTEFAFVLLYGFVFLWHTQQDENDNQLYYRLMLLGMLKIAFNSLFMESYYIALVLNSLKRILLCQNREQIEKSTIGCYEDFLKKNAKKISSNSSDRQSTESSLSQQSSISVSLLGSSLRLTGELFQPNIEIKEMKTHHQNNKQIKKQKKKYTERGEIKIFELGKYIKQNIQSILYIASILLGLITFYIKFENLRISSSILHMKMEMFQYIVFFAPTILYTLFYLSIILIFGQVSRNLFKNLSSQEIQGQDLNRISGDIEMVDKYVPPAFYEFFITVFGVLASLVLTVSLIKDPLLAILTSILLLAIIWLCIYFNRYFMKSRRQLKRLQCKNKSSILQRYAQQINQHNEQEIRFNKVEKNWKRINLLKNIGIVIENNYIFILNVFVLMIQILCFIVCFVGDVERSTGKLILTFVLQLDLSLTGLLLNTINLQMGLVNFQRCLNFVKRTKTISNMQEIQNNQN